MFEFILGYWWVWLITAAVCGTVSYFCYKKRKEAELKAQFVVAAGSITIITIIILIFNLIGIIAAVLGIVSFILGLIRWMVGF